MYFLFQMGSRISLSHEALLVVRRLDLILPTT
jgi:hypothetical protein